MRLRKGKGNSVGECIEKTTSDASGQYRFQDVAPGYYTVEVVDQRGDEKGTFITTTVNTIVRSNQTTTASVALTQFITGSQVRFVLTWGDMASGAVSDLDSHLIGPKAGGTGTFHTYYSDKTYTEYDEETEEDTKYADLDLDDVDYEGPETTTIYQPVDGMYNFYVHNYSDKEDDPSSTMAASNAKVEVYQGTTLLLTYYMPNQPGTLWHVCSYDSKTGTLTQSNEVTYESDEDEVGRDPRERAAERLEKQLNAMGNLLSNLVNNDAKTRLQETYDKYQGILENSADSSVDQLTTYATEVKTMVDAVNDQTSITGVEMSEVDDTVDIDNTYSEIDLYTFDPSSMSIANVQIATDSTYELVKEDSIVTAIRVTSSDGYVRVFSVYYYTRSLAINNITNANGSIPYDIDYEYDEEGEQSSTILSVGTPDGMPTDFAVDVNCSAAEVVTAKDASGHINQVTIQYGTQKVEYQVKYYTIPYYVTGITAASGNDNAITYKMYYDDAEIYIYGSKDQLGALNISVPEGYTYEVPEDYESCEDWDSFSLKLTNAEGDSRTYYCVYYVE